MSADCVPLKKTSRVIDRSVIGKVPDSDCFHPPRVSFDVLEASDVTIPAYNFVVRILDFLPIARQVYVRADMRVAAVRRRNLRYDITAVNNT
jgi:hypothetical protein